MTPAPDFADIASRAAARGIMVTAAGVEEIAGLLAKLQDDKLETALASIRDNFMTSETHHPGWVLIREEAHSILATRLPGVLAALTPPVDGDEFVMVPPPNGEKDPEWAAIKRAIDQFVGRVPTVGKHRAVNNAHLAETVAHLDAIGERAAADTIVWLCWWRALDRERERFLAASPSRPSTEAELRADVALWKREAADRSESMVQLNLDRAAMGVGLMQLREALTAVNAVRPSNWQDSDDPEQAAAWALLDATLQETARL